MITYPTENGIMIQAESIFEKEYLHRIFGNHRITVAFHRETLIGISLTATPLIEQQQTEQDELKEFIKANVIGE